MTDPTTDAPPAPDVPDRLRLAQPEDEHSIEEWEKAAAAVLRKSGRIKADEPDSVVWERLARRTLDDISIPPLGTPALREYAAGGRPDRVGRWDIRALVSHPDPKLANEAALVDLEGGVTSLWLAVDAATEPSADLRTILDGVHLELAPVVLDAPAATLATARALVDLGPLHPDSNLGACALSEDLADVARLAGEAGVRGVVVDAIEAHDLGASEAQELGYSMALGVAALRRLADAGLPLSEAAATIEFRYAATVEQFPTIAKLRAARRLWARALELSGVDGAVQRQHAVTSRPMLSKYDPHVNMLRGTVAAFAAGVGGADAVTVLPFDSALGRPEGFGRRIARNVSHLLIEESHVAAVVDPAGGSYAVEKLTADLAAAGWAEFQRIERDGLDAFRARVADVAARREADVVRRKRPITGLSEFPNLDEPLPVRDADPQADRVRRYGAAFEALRDEPVATRVFLATMGPLAHHTARSGFATNLLAAGGIGVEVAGPTVDAADLARKYAAAGSPEVVCLAGSDTAYAEWGAEAATALREAGASYVILAGRPADALVELVDDSAATGDDAIAFLTRVRERLS